MADQKPKFFKLEVGGVTSPSFAMDIFMYIL